MSAARRRRRRAKIERAARPHAGDPGKASPHNIEIAGWAAFFAVAIGALIWNQHTQFFYSWTDEQLHFYVAHRMAQGAVLYRDIDSARPPMILFPLAWLIRLGCSPMLAGRSVVVVAQLATAGLLLWGGWRLASLRAGALAALLLLTSPEVFARVHYTGIHLVALTAAACVLFSLRKQPFRAGLLFGLTLVTDQHGLVVCGIVAALTVVQRPRAGLAFATGAIVVSAIVFGGVWAAGGRHLWQSLVGIHLYHLRLGQGVGAQFWEQFKPWVCEHGYLFVGAALAGVLSKKLPSEGATDPRPTGAAASSVRVLALVIVAHVAVVLALAEAVFLYVVVIAPLLMLLAGMGFDAALTWWRERSRLSQARALHASRRMLAGTVAVVTLTAAGWAAASFQREGLDGRHYSFWPHLLHQQVSRTQELDPVLQEISESLPPRSGTIFATIFGDPTIVSALALRAGRRVSAELADLNPNWLEAGTIRPEEVVSRIENDAVAAVISPPFGLVQNPYFKSYLFACYQKPKPFFPPESGPGEALPFLLVFTRTQTKGPCHAPTGP